MLNFILIETREWAIMESSSLSGGEFLVSTPTNCWYKIMYEVKLIDSRYSVAASRGKASAGNSGDLSEFTLVTFLLHTIENQLSAELNRARVIIV